MTDESIGWRSRLDIALATHRRIVLYGNTKDVILEGETQLLTLSDWLVARLTAAFFERIVRYDHAEPPFTHRWPANTTNPFAMGAAPAAVGFGAGPPGPVDHLRRLGEMLADRQSAAILEGAAHRIDKPGPEQVQLFKLGRATPQGAPAHGIAIHIYGSEFQVPGELVRSDPDTSVILVALPTKEERLAYIEKQPTAGRLRGMKLRGRDLDIDQIARLTEGYSLIELGHLSSLAASSPEIEIDALMATYRNGRRANFFADIDEDAIRTALNNDVRGQAPAIIQVMNSIKRAREDIWPLIDEFTRKPAMVLFFVGATGVGKTHLARAICRELIGNEESLKRLDMTEYQQEHTDQRLIGPPPGYVGYQEGGQLTNWVLERPHSVVLIDEVEKAHPRILDKFMQILEGARLTDGKGQTVDMTETILVFTSNIGASEALGQGLDPTDRDAIDAYFREQVEEYFEIEERLEIFGRLKNEIVVFDYIGSDVARPMIVKKLRDIARKASERAGDAFRIHFNETDAQDQRVVEGLLKKANYEKYGLRDVNNVTYQKLGTQLADWLGDRRRTAPDWCFYWNEGESKVEIRERVGPPR